MAGLDEDDLAILKIVIETLQAFSAWRQHHALVVPGRDRDFCSCCRKASPERGFHKPSVRVDGLVPRLPEKQT
jgi:hypothetical protein